MNITVHAFVSLSFCLALLPRSAAAADAQVAFGNRHGVALRTNGEVLTWGDNVSCQLGRRTGNSDPNPGLVMRNVKQIAVASEHTLVLTEEGKVYGWGQNGDGELGTGDEYEKCEGPVLITSLAGKTITHIATGYDFSVAVSSSGDLYCTGDNAMSQCPVSKGFDNATAFTLVPFPHLAGNVADVRSGSFHTLVLTKAGTLFAFGRGLDGQLGTGKAASGSGAVTMLTDIVSFSAGTWHSVAVRRDGTVWAWGNNSRSQLCDGTTTNRNVPTEMALPGGAKAVQIAAGTHGTMIRTAGNTLLVCGDNQFGPLGFSDRPVVSTPTLVPGAVAASPVLAVSGHASAFSSDGCALRLAGRNESGILTFPVTATTPSGYFSRQAPALCAAKSTAPAGDIVNPAPSGGESGCWTTRKEEDASKSPKFAGQRQAMLDAESLLKKNRDFMTALEPVRFRTSLSAGPFAESGARMHVKVVPERKQDGTRVWAAGCEVIPQLDRIGGAIAQVSIFFNSWQEEFVGNVGTPPVLTGTFGGFPEYNHWILITKDGRLPWIPHTLDDKLTALAEKRERALAEWKGNRSGMEMYPQQLAQLEKQLGDLKAYRASFTPAQLRAPAVWGDPSGDGRRQLDVRAGAMRALPSELQQQADTLGRESRDLERQAQAETRNQNPEAATRLRARSAELALKVRAIRDAHMEAVTPLILDALAQYDLTNLRPGAAAQAISVKPDPAVVASIAADPNRIQIIALAFSEDPDPKKAERRAWQARFKQSFDYASLAALLR